MYLAWLSKTFSSVDILCSNLSTTFWWISNSSLLLFGFGLFVGIYPQGDQTVGILIMFGGLAQIIYSIGVVNEWGHGKSTTNRRTRRR